MFWKAVAIFPIASFIIYRTIWGLYFLDFHKTVYIHHPGPCHLVEGIEHGSEDIESLPNGLTFISSGLRWVGLSPEEEKVRKGKIFLFDFDNIKGKPQQLKIEGETFKEATFNPHGLSLWQDPKSGSTFLFIVNHLEDKSVVEKFIFEDKTKILRHRQTFSDPTFKYLNNLVVTGEDKFYYTNALYYRSVVELSLAMPWGSVGYYDGKAGKLVITSLDAPNGINIDPKGRYLYVSLIGRHSIGVYEIADPYTLSETQLVPVGSCCDNLGLDKESRTIWAGCHQVIHENAGYLKTPSVSKSASQVLKFHIENNGLLRNNSITQVYSDNGEQFSGSTIAVQRKNKMLIGSVYTRLLLCDLVHV